MYQLTLNKLEPIVKNELSGQKNLIFVPECFLSWKNIFRIWVSKELLILFLLNLFLF